MRKRTPTASTRTSDRGSRKTMRKGTLNVSGKKISQGILDASAEQVNHGTPPAEIIPFGRPNAGELNANALPENTELQKSMFLQNFVDEWFEFLGKRTRQQMHLIETIQGCQSLPDVQQAYSEFWQNAFTQYAEEPRRMLRIAQEAVDAAFHGNGATKATLH
jgi:hypothetical protein